MRPADFDYRRCDDLGQATGLLLQHPDAALLSGGQSLLPLLRSRLVRPDVVIDISRVPGLSDITTGPGALVIGALVTVAEVGRSGALAEASPMLADAAGVIADPSIRSLGTVGGNLAHADPLNDLPAVLLAAAGHVVVASQEDRRRIHAVDLFDGPFTTTLRRGEVIETVVIPASPTSSYQKFKRATADYGVCAAAVHLDVDGDGVVASAGISLSGTAVGAVRAPEAEDLIVGVAVSELDSAMIGSAAANSARFEGDERGSGRYQRAVAAATASKAVTRAASRFRGGQ